ncbi:MAG TPA: serine/threonine-protein kinase [Pseudomonadota bacterium]|nr:serine/threonine-protein kinase [Pseudomonadota bacterium]
MRLPVGQRIGSYVIAELLGEGGTSEVYLARREGVAFALKILKEEHRPNSAQQARLINEAEVLRTLDVAGVVRLFGEGDFEGRPYYVMEYLPTTLAERLGAPLLPSQILPLIGKLARILHELHVRGYVHRDVKPRNILFAPDGSLRLADFGLAKLPMDELAVVPHSTATGAFLGTHAYAAPEQLLNAKSVDGRADVYALGLILFEALAGRPPFHAQSAEELAHLRLTLRAPRLQSPLVTLSPQLVVLVAHMLERFHDRRPSAQEVLQRLASTSFPHAPTLPRRRFASLLILPLFLSNLPLSCPPNPPAMGAPEASSMRGSLDPARRTPKELFEAFGLALDTRSLEDASTLLKQAEALPLSPEHSAKLLQKQADLARELGQLEGARQIYQQARTRFQQLGIRRDWASCAIREADLMVHLGESVPAYDLYDKASRYHSAVLTRPELARGNEVHLAFFHLGLYFTELQQFDQASELFLLAKDAAPSTEPLLMARTEERLAALPTEPAAMRLALSAITYGQQAVNQSPHSRRAQIALVRAQLRHALLSHDAQAMQRVLTPLHALWSVDKRRATIGHDHAELLMEAIKHQPARTDWIEQAREVVREMQQQGQWQGDVHLEHWKVKLGA